MQIKFSNETFFELLHVETCAEDCTKFVKDCIKFMKDCIKFAENCIKSAEDDVKANWSAKNNWKTSMQRKKYWCEFVWIDARQQQHC